jgi:hypothetical protein
MGRSLFQLINRTHFFTTPHGDFCATKVKGVGWSVHRVVHDGLHHIAHVATLDDTRVLIAEFLKE